MSKGAKIGKVRRALQLKKSRITMQKMAEWVKIQRFHGAVEKMP